MKTARLFLIGMYLHLVLSIAAPIGMLALDWNGGGNLLACACLVTAALAVPLGVVCAIMGFVASGQRHMGRLVTGWRMLKLRSIPFYVLLFLWSAAVGVFSAITSRDILFVLVLASGGLMCVFVFLSGCLGIALVHTMRRHKDGPSALHYLGQILPVADIFSTLFLLRVLHVDNIN